MNWKKALKGISITYTWPFGISVSWREPDNKQFRLSGLGWEYASAGRIPKDALVAGSEATGEELYIARAKWENGMHIGKVRPGFGGAKIPLGDHEITVNPYEVFVGNCGWREAEDGAIPLGAVVAGYESDGKPLYVARAEYAGGIHIGKVRREYGGANIPYGGKEIKVNVYEVLVSEENA